jgi:hypothetical protein
MNNELYTEREILKDNYEYVSHNNDYYLYKARNNDRAYQLFIRDEVFPQFYSKSLSGIRPPRKNEQLDLFYDSNARLDYLNYDIMRRFTWSDK